MSLGMPPVPPFGTPTTPHVFGGLMGKMAESLKSNRMTLREFNRASWNIIEPGRVFVEDKIDTILAEYLEAVTFGLIKRLIFNLPPRSGKSNRVTIQWPAWAWTMLPNKRFLFCSYSDKLTMKHSVKRRRLIESGLYQGKWGHIVALERDQNRQTEYENTRRGLMFSTSTGGSVTGSGGDILVGDDILDPLKAESEAERTAAHDFLDHVWSTRLDDPIQGAKVFIEQRLHVQDVTAHVKDQEPYVIVSLPAKFREPYEIKLPMSGQVVRFEADELLCPRRFDDKYLASQKIILGTRGYSAQYDQSPLPASGNMVELGWWKYYRELPVVTKSIWSWDTAVKVQSKNDFSVGGKINVCAAGYYLSRIFRKKMEYPELKRQMMNLYAAEPTSAVLVEDKSSGQQIIQDLRRDTRLPIIANEPVNDKVTRLSLVSPIIESGKVYLQEGAPWVADFVQEFMEFPDGQFDDQVDVMTQGLRYLAGLAAPWKEWV